MLRDRLMRLLRRPPLPLRARIKGAYIIPSIDGHSCQGWRGPGHCIRCDRERYGL